MSSTRKVGDERLYYTPPAMRRHKHQQLQNSKPSSSSSPERRVLESDSNLDRFLEHTTPSVTAQHFPRTSVQAWRNSIQLYVDPSRNVTERRPGEESDATSSSSDGENECRLDRGADIRNPPGLLIFEYFERELPFHREPLADKVVKEDKMLLEASSYCQPLDLFRTSLKYLTGMKMEFMKARR